MWERRSGLDPADLEYALGTGVIAFTPVGPVRIDAARNVTGDESLRDNWSFHFSIGHAY